MTHRQSKRHLRCSTASRRRDTIDLRRSALYVALAIGLGASPALLAQSDPATESGQETAEDAEQEDEAVELEDIAVTGFARSVERSIGTKRNSDSIVEAVFAEDIGKLPDVSIAEALARMPGLTAQRTDGRAQTIAVRGLGPDFSTALLNGREQVTTGDNRGVEFDQYPSELLNAVVVYKTPNASLVGQGLAGTIDMRTIRPLSAADEVLSVGARYEFNGDDALNPDADDDGYRANVVYVGQNDDRSFGITFGAAIQSTPNQIERFNAWGYPNVSDGGPVTPGGAKPYVHSNELERIGLLTTLEWAHSDSLHSILDISYSDFEETQILRGIEFPLFWSAAQLRDGFTVDDGLVVEGVYDNVHGVMRSDLNQREAELLTAGWNTEWFIDNQWAMRFDLSYSRAERSDRLVESYAGTGYATSGLADSLGFRIPDSGVFQFDPSIDYADPSLFSITDPQGWGAGAQPDPLTQAGFINTPDTEDSLTRARVELDRGFSSGLFKSATLGVDYAVRDKERRIGQTFLTPPGNAESVAFPPEALIGTTPLGFIGIPGMIAWDPQYLLDNLYDQVDVQLSSFSVPQDWTVEEDVLTTFLRLDIDTYIGDVPVRGNVGVQAVHTDQTASGFRVAGAEVGAGVAEGSFVPVVDGDDYWRFLPSVNLIFDLGSDQLVRFGASRVMARPRMDQLNASLSLNTDFTRLNSTDPQQAFFSAGGGNPALRPIMADTIDLSYERYFMDDAGYFSASLFYKDLDDYVNGNDSFVADFSAFVDDFLSPDQAAQLGTTQGLVSGPTNRGDGYIRGAELAAALPAHAISESLQGFGLLVSASYTESSVYLGDASEDITVPGLSDLVANTTLYYERAGFQARISHRYRSEFLSEVFGLSATRVTREAESESLIDAQIGYEFSSGPLAGVNVFLQGNNLTNEPFVTFQNGDGRQVIDYQRFGRNFLLGASYQF